MNADNPIHRFDELDAGRALGDLDAAERAELAALGGRRDPGLDRLVAELEIAAFEKIPAVLPPALAARLRHNIPRASDRKFSIVPWAGWALAACVTALLVIREILPDAGMDPIRGRAEMLAEADGVLKLPLAGAAGAYAAAGGDVVWSGADQRGYLTLTNIPANDPSRNQYQLWIVDPARDEFPVDGGVFDIPAGPGPVVIPVAAKLPVANPAAFVITLEKPGGVVRSKQETVVALAKS